MYAPYVKTAVQAVTSTAAKVRDYTPDRSYLAIFNIDEEEDLLVALNNGTPGTNDYFIIPAKGHFEFTCPVASAVWLKASGSMNAVIAEAK
jgi:hypothetical protein